MGGLPRQQDVARAQSRVNRDGRPLRMRTICILMGADPEAWRGMDRETQAEALAPFIDLERERFHFSNAGEGFIVDAELGGVGQADTSAVSLERLQSTRAAERSFHRFLEKQSRESFTQGFAAAIRHVAPMFVQVIEQSLEEGLDPKATDAQKDRAVKVTKDVMDRLGGKAVVATEDVTARDTDARAWMAKARPKVLPVSAHVTVEQAGEIARLELEAGSVLEQEDEG